MNRMQLSAAAERMIRVLEQAGYETWAVGGWVRDGLRGAEPNDVDLAAASAPEQTMAVCGRAGIPVHPTGAAHGTVTAVLDGETFEITTWRVDGRYSDGRRPDSVRFTPCFREDLARRDFTVNAMAWHPERGLFDPFGGQQDLEKRQIRCVGEPERRFAEDRLRILRALRMASCLSFSVEASAQRAMEQDAAQIAGSVAAERIGAELRRLVTGPSAASVLLCGERVLRQAVPVLDEIDFVRASGLFDRLRPEEALRFAALARCSRGDPRSTAEALCRALRLDRRCAGKTAAILAASEQAEREDLDSRPAMKRLLHDFGTEAAGGAALGAAWTGRGSPGGGAALIADILASGEAWCPAMLAADGAELRALAGSGAATGRLLQMLCEEVFCGRVPNEHEALISAAKRCLAACPAGGSGKELC